MNYTEIFANMLNGGYVAADAENNILRVYYGYFIDCNSQRPAVVTINVKTKQVEINNYSGEDYNNHNVYSSLVNIAKKAKADDNLFKLYAIAKNYIAKQEAFVEAHTC